MVAALREHYRELGERQANMAQGSDDVRILELRPGIPAVAVHGVGPSRAQKILGVVEAQRAHGQPRQACQLPDAEVVVVHIAESSASTLSRVKAGQQPAINGSSAALVTMWVCP